LGVRQGEERLVGLGCLLAFCALAMNVLVLATVTALFLGQRPRSDLPLAYGAAALFGLVSAFALTALSNRVARVREASLVFVSLALALVVSWAALPFVDSVFLFVVYPVCTGLAALSVVQAFAVVSDCVDAEQAKRLLPLIGSGGTLGAVGAGASMAFLVPTLGTRVLLIFAAVAALAAVWVAMVLVRSHVSERAQSVRPQRAVDAGASSLTNFIDDVSGYLLKDRLLYSFALSQCAITIASTLLRFEFESALQTRLAMDRIAVFLGLFNLGANASVLIVQTLLERRILRRFGLFFGLTSVPALFLLAMPLLWLGPGLVGVAGARFVEHVLRFSLARTADDLVLLPLSSAKRRRGKTLVAGALIPLSVLATSGLLLASSALPMGFRSAMAWLCGGLALWLALSMRRPYLARLEMELSQPRLTLDSLSAPALHASRAGIEAAMEQTLREADPRRVAFALSTLAETRISVDPRSLRDLYSNPDPRLREAAYVAATTTGNDSWLEGLLRAYENERDDGARTACARALCTHLPARRLTELERLLDDPSLGVRAEVLARRDTLQALNDPNLEVRRAGLWVASLTHAPELLSATVKALGERRLAAAASDALRSWPGADVVDALAASTSADRPAALRKRAVRALARIAHPKAQRSLITLLQSEAEDIQTAALRGLVRQRRAGTAAEEMGALMRDGVVNETRSMHVARLALERSSRSSDPRAAAIARELKEWYARCEGRLFLWLSLGYPPAEMLRTKLSLASDDRRARAFALELLERRLDVSLRRQLDSFWIGVSIDEQATVAERALELPRGQKLAQVLALAKRPVTRWLAFYLAPEARVVPIEGDPSMSVLETMFVLRTVELFSRLSSEELRALAELSQTRRVNAGETLFREGDPGDAFYVIKAGQAEVTKKGKLLATLREGDWFGELALLDDGVRTATVTAHIDTELTCVLSADFHELLEEVPSIARAMLGVLAKRQTRLLDGQPD